MKLTRKQKIELMKRIIATEEGSWTFTSNWDIPPFMCPGKTRQGMVPVGNEYGIFEFRPYSEISGGVPIDNFFEGDNITLEKDIQKNTIRISARGGGGAPSDYVEKIQPNDYSITYTYYEKDQFHQNEIYFASINGESVIGKVNFDLQPKLDSESIIEVKQIWFGHYYIDEPSLEAMLDAVAELEERALKTPSVAPSAIQLVAIGTNGAQQQINVGGGLAIDNSTLHTTGGGGGGNPLYLHTVSFNTLTSPEIHFQVGVISSSASRYANFDAFWNDRKKIITLFGTPNMRSNALYFNGALADQYTIKARGVTLEDGEFTTDVIDIGYSDIDAQSFGDYGVEPLDNSSLKSKTIKQVSKKKKTKIEKVSIWKRIKNLFKRGK